MNQDGFDKMIRELVPPIAISQERVDALVDRMMEDLPARTRRRGPWRWPALFPALRFAVPMAAALAFALIVDRQYDMDLSVAQFSDLLVGNTMFSWGS